MFKIEKFRRRATLRLSTGGMLDVNFFLGYHSEIHRANETILDLLNSDRAFMPVEDSFTNEILLIGKDKIMTLELPERDLLPEKLSCPAISVRIELIDGDIFYGIFHIDMPPDKSRLSDYLNTRYKFVYLCLEQNDLILNKTYIFSVKET